ncbi:hypothetical protein Pme01_19820 [Planosporangium mesophilum]|uniref:Uncharacterized protein n=1 Tax=Planosporangium mesophilum TaxID=689768 RepID=A0A8J3WZJ2_9ACTN|nr:hypothetical protein Pme01_19820 [Planosporangium mesophilum]
MPDAAVATGTLAMAVKLPGFDASVGTAAQPAPNVSPVMAACVVGAGAGAAGVVFCGLEDVLPPFDPHADRANTPAAPTATRLAILDLIIYFSRRGRGVIDGYSPGVDVRMGGATDGECHASLDPSGGRAAPNPLPIR